MSRYKIDKLIYIGFENKPFFQELKSCIEADLKIFDESAFYLCKTNAGVIRFSYCNGNTFVFDCVIEEK